MTDKEKLLEAWGRILRHTTKYGNFQNGCQYDYDVQTIEAHLATLDAVSKEDAEMALDIIESGGLSIDNKYNARCFKVFKTIRTLLRAHAGVK